MIREFVFASPRNFAITILTLAILWLTTAIVVGVYALGYVRRLVDAEGNLISHRDVLSEAFTITKAITCIFVFLEGLLFVLLILL